MHYRASLRAAVRAALSADIAFADVTVIEGWHQSFDEDAMPAIAVFTPREEVERQGVRSKSRTVDVVVQLRSLGGAALEDELDDRSGAIELVVLPVLESLTADAWISVTDVEIDGQSGRRIGKLNVVFRAVRLTE